MEIKTCKKYFCMALRYEHISYSNESWSVGSSARESPVDTAYIQIHIKREGQVPRTC